MIGICSRPSAISFLFSFFIGIYAELSLLRLAQNLRLCKISAGLLVDVTLDGDSMYLSGLVSLVLLVSLGLSDSLVTYESLGCSASLFFPAGQVLCRFYRDHLPRIYKALRAVFRKAVFSSPASPYFI